MIIITHIIIALLSVVSSGVLFFRQSKFNFTVTYSLVAATLLSGTYLVFESKASLTHACISGLAYLGIILIGLIPAHIKFASKADKSI